MSLSFIAMTCAIEARSLLGQPEIVAVKERLFHPYYEIDMCTLQQSVVVGSGHLPITHVGAGNRFRREIFSSDVVGYWTIFINHRFEKIRTYCACFSFISGSAELLGGSLGGSWRKRFTDYKHSTHLCECFGI